HAGESYAGWAGSYDTNVKAGGEPVALAGPCAEDQTNNTASSSKSNTQPSTTTISSQLAGTDDPRGQYQGAGRSAAPTPSSATWTNLRRPNITPRSLAASWRGRIVPHIAARRTALSRPDEHKALVQ